MLGASAGFCPAEDASKVAARALCADVGRIGRKCVREQVAPGGQAMMSRILAAQCVSECKGHA